MATFSAGDVMTSVTARAPILMAPREASVPPRVSPWCTSGWIRLLLSVVTGSVVMGANVRLATIARRSTTFAAMPGEERSTAGLGAPAAASNDECAAPQPGWIWCDDFEQDRLSRYFEYDSADGSFVRVRGVGRNGSYGMRAQFARGQVSAGALHLAMGAVPSKYFRTVDEGTAIYRDVYWRVYVRNQRRWVGGAGNKLTRASSIVTSNWAEAMAGHLWGGDSPDTNLLQLDPVSGTDPLGNLQAAHYNDFAHFHWLGKKLGVTPLFDASHVGQWYCVEAHARVNDAGLSNGVFEFWINGNLEARETNLNWVGSFSGYGINAVFFENYWNAGSAAAQERYLDDLVVAQQRIGC